MSLLSDDSLEFAKKHIERYYDSDFFPKSQEYSALWHSWDSVKKELSSTNISKIFVASPTTSTSMKPKGGFRIVQQLDPLSTLVYTALAYTVADAVESKRPSRELNIACSYRIDLKDGSFFAEGNGFSNYVENSEFLASTHEYVLSTDITDFYNQIYLHRLNNAIEFSDSSLSNIANDVENFLSKLNGKTSQGVPVGPAASVVMAEAILIDIDEFIINKGLKHTRYVDDYRIFSDNKDELVSVLEDLTLYLYKNHRLTIATDKTEITDCSTYIEEILHNHYELEKTEIFKKLEVYNPYSNEIEELEECITDDVERFGEQMNLISQKILERKYLDLGIARYFLRKSKNYSISESAELIFSNFEFFLPVVNDVFLYLDKVSNEDFVERWKDSIIQLSESSFIDRDLFKIWFEWYISRNVHLLNISLLRKFIFEKSSINSQSQAAILLKNISWIRSKKEDLYEVNNKDRLAILRAAQILAKDERDHWLKLTEQTAPLPLDRWVAKWVRETT
ncbi:RNA-directed DNA polymerase [Psychrobacter urativorans]|uniref:RNA-directed DNA polymerase n=1 Tax=Psychrobacter urativorans TaxID=45610 RepID=UPI0019196795|nr:RNA-directed DNA polymerase [Psychrobacter urativorans]